MLLCAAKLLNICVRLRKTTIFLSASPAFLTYMRIDHAARETCACCGVPRRVAGARPYDSQKTHFCVSQEPLCIMKRAILRWRNEPFCVVVNAVLLTNMSYDLIHKWFADIVVARSAACLGLCPEGRLAFCVSRHARKKKMRRHVLHV